MSERTLEDIVKNWDNLNFKIPSVIKCSPNKKSNGIKIQDMNSSINELEKCPLRQLTEYSVTGQSKKLREQMLADQFILKNIAIMGQCTTIYGSPNSGKTLITNWLLRESILSEEIDGEMVFYINADDNYRGLVEKIELAEDWGMHMIAPHHKNFTVDQVPELMGRMADDGSSRGAVIILDTLKKFTDLMDKRTASQFGVAARGFVSAGGTLIALAHTNKHAGTDGKAIYSGTSDIVDDSDCCFVIDKISLEERDGTATHTLEFSNIKARGDVSSKIGFSYEKRYGQEYAALLDSVKWLDRSRIDQIKEEADIQAGLDADSTIILAIQEQMANGTVTKDKIIKGVNEQTDESINRIKKVLERRTGDNHRLGQRWSYHKGAHNRYVFAVLPTPQ